MDTKKIIFHFFLLSNLAIFSCAEPEFKSSDNRNSKDSAELKGDDSGDASIKQMGVDEEEFTVDAKSVKQIDIEIMVTKEKPPIAVDPGDDPEYYCGGVSQNGNVSQNEPTNCIPPIITCPSGTVLDGKICVPVKCDLGYQILENKCQPIACLNGQELVDGKCQTITCAKGEIMIDGACKVPPVCPAGSLQIIGQCECKPPLRMINGSCKLIECPTNMVMTVKGCEPIITCKADEKLINGKCEKIICIDTGMLRQDFQKLVAESTFLQSYLTKYPATDLIKWTIKKRASSTQNADFNNITIENLGGMNMVTKHVYGKEYTDKLKGGITRKNLQNGLNAAKAEAMKLIPREANIIPTPNNAALERIWKLKNKVWSSTTAASKIPGFSFDMYVGIKLEINGTKYNSGKGWAWDSIKYVHNKKLYEVVVFYYALQASNGWDGEFMSVSQLPREIGDECQ